MRKTSLGLAEDVRSAVDAELGRRIKAARELRKMSQSALGHEVELSRTSIASIEAGRQAINVASLYRFGRALQCDVVDLLPASDPGLDTQDLEKDDFVALIRAKAQNG